MQACQTMTLFLLTREREMWMGNGEREDRLFSTSLIIIVDARKMRIISSGITQRALNKI